VAAPALVAARIVEDGPRLDVTYSPWFTANLTLDRWPRERGLEVAWDNVIFDSPSLGYVVATHQHLRRHQRETVWTHYWALADQGPAAARRSLLAASWPDLAERVLADLSRAHPDIRECVTRIDIMRLGHAMPRPVPGFLSAAGRSAMQAGHDGVFYAHSDVSGLPLFEEAQYRGVLAADQAMTHLA
jgi:hypothetical protein